MLNGTNFVMLLTQVALEYKLTFSDCEIDVAEICLLAKIKRTASIRAESYCNLYSLEVEDFNEVLTEFPQMRSQLEIVARERLAQLGKRTNVLETKSRLKHQDMSYGVAISTDDFAEIAEMANEETRKMVRRLVKLRY